ncbi:hypothetical protein AKJ16_DCAP03707 [Drosera capensis]
MTRKWLRHSVYVFKISLLSFVHILQKLLQGYKRGRGIVCAQSDQEISPSQFEGHAGCVARRLLEREQSCHSDNL